MLIEEAKWIGNELGRLIHLGNIKKVLNIGSSTADSWTSVQKHVKEFVMLPLEKSNISIVNTDIKDGEGVEIAGDLNDEEFIKKLNEDKFDLIICSNLLEHVESPVRIASHISQLVRKGSFAIITVPRNYPYHPDPEDYLFRPDINGLKDLFRGLDCVSAAIVEGRRALVKNNRIKYCSNYIQVLINDPRLLILTFLRLITPFYRYSNWKKTAGYLPYIFKPFSVTCMVLVKQENHD